MDEKKIKILIVDDEKDFTDLIKEALDNIGKYEVRVDNSGKNAVAVAEEFMPDVILLDVIIPQMYGTDIADELSKNMRLNRIPIIFLTAAVTTEEEGMIGGHLFISKPVNFQELIDCIEKVTT